MIKVVASTQTARSRRANILVLDEFRMIDPLIYRNVLRRFLAVSRQPGYLKIEEYKTKRIHGTKSGNIYKLSYYKYNWAYMRYSVFVKSMLQGKGYFVCGLPYQIAIKEGLANKQQLIDEMQEEDLDFIGWRMEMECLFFGESEKAYFKTEELNNIKKINFPIYGKELQDKIKNKVLIQKKTPNEVRILSCDIALLGGDQNDASVFTLIVGKKTANGTKYKRYVKNITACREFIPKCRL